MTFRNRSTHPAPPDGLERLFTRAQDRLRSGVHPVDPPERFADRVVNWIDDHDNEIFVGFLLVTGALVLATVACVILAIVGPK